MKTKVKTRADVAVVHIQVAVRYEEEDIPNDFPLRKGNSWEAYVAVDTGKIADWPVGRSEHLHMKVCDEGTYTLLDKNNNIIAAREQDYVPHGIVPGKYGDYIDLEIDVNGIITNWPKQPDFSEIIERTSDTPYDPYNL